MAAKMGRPTDSPKISRVTARIDIDTKKYLINTKKHNINQAEAVRRAILKLLEDV